MEKVQGNPRSCLQPLPKVIITCRGADGKSNALSVAYCCNCSYDPPMVMVGIVPSRYSHPMIKETGCFVVNLVTKDQKDAFEYFGTHSGRDGDKLEHMNSALKEGVEVNVPMLEESPVNIECRVVHSFVTGSHEMFVAAIEEVHVSPSLVKEDGTINYAGIDFL